MTTFMLSMQKGMRQQPRRQRPPQSTPRRLIPPQAAQVTISFSDTVLELEVGENYNSMHRFLPGGDVRLTMRTDNVDGSVTEDITCHGWRCDHLGMEYEVYNTYNTVPGGEIYLLAPPVGWEWERGRPVLAAPCCREYNL